jgi:hypothetical protein
LQALALVFQLNALAFDIYLVFFGCRCVLIGYLIFGQPSCLEFRCYRLMVSWMTFLSPSLDAICSGHAYRRRLAGYR